MKTLVKETLAKRLTVVVLALAAIVGVCAFAFSGTHNNAWAEGEGPIATWNSVPEPGVGGVPANAGKNLTLEIKQASSSDHLEAHFTNNDGDTIPPSVLELTTEDGSVLTAYFGEDILPTNQAASSIEGSDAGTRFTKAELYLIPETVTVTFDMNGHGAQIDPIPVEKGTSVTLPEDPTAEGWTFKGWTTDPENTIPFDSAQSIESAITLYASWTENEPEMVDVIFDMNGHGTQIDPIPVEKGTSVTLPEDPTAEGWTFKGWTTDPENTIPFDSAQSIESAITLYASWTENEPEMVDVIFDMNGHGDKVAKQTEKGKPITLIDDPTADGYTFKGWTYDKEGKQAFDAKKNADQDTTLYAQWEKNAEPDVPPADDPSDESDSNSSDATEPAADPTDFTIVISKTDAKTGKALSGAEFTLADKAGNVVDSWISDGTSKTYTLDRGASYVLTETKAPTGYNREKAININFSTDDGKASVKIDQGGRAVALPVNNDGNAALNVKDLSGTALQGTSTTAPKTGDNQNMPLASLCFGAAALVAGGIAATAYRKRQAL